MGRILGRESGASRGSVCRRGVVDASTASRTGRLTISVVAGKHLSRILRELMSRITANWHVSPAQRLLNDLQVFLGRDEQFLGAFVAHVGASPSRQALGFTLSALFGGGFEGKRASFTIAMTDRAVIVLRNDDKNRPSTVHSRHEGHSSLGGVRGTGDYSVTVAGVRYWLTDRWVDEARRLDRMRNSR